MAGNLTTSSNIITNALGTLRPQDTSALNLVNYSAKVSRQFGTGAEVSLRVETLRHQCQTGSE